MERTEIISCLKQAFNVEPKFEKLQACHSIEDFQKVFSDDFFPQVYKEIYSWETEDIQYLLPYALEYHLLHYGESVEGDGGIEMFYSIVLQGQNDDDAVINKRYDDLYDGFNPKQSKAICNFLRYVKEHDLGYYFEKTDAAISFWCKKAAMQ
jgi:hypothetical protein